MYIMCLSKGLEAVRLPINKGLLPKMTLGFIGTAGETYVDPKFVERSRQCLRAMDINLVEIDVSNDSRKESISLLESVDGVYVAGGNSFYLLRQLKNKGLDAYISDRVRNGLPYFGESAGAVILAKSIEPAKAIDSPEDAPGLTDYRGLGLVDFFPLPHVGHEKYHELFAKFVTDNESQISIVQYTDNQAIVTRNGCDYEIIAS